MEPEVITAASEPASSAPAGIERRDVRARIARDRLAGFLDVHPRNLSHLDAELAQTIASRIDELIDALQASRMDSVTGAVVRSVGRAGLEREMTRARRGGSPLSVIFIDLDELKTINDTYGHAAGDRLLRDTVRALSEQLRPYDTVIRWGGDEFVCVLPDCDLGLARQIGERILDDFISNRGARWTPGYAQLTDGDDLDDLIERADADLYGKKTRRYN